MHNVLHHCAILQSCCQQFLPQIPASIPACVRPKARQQKFSAEIRGGLGTGAGCVVGVRQNWCELQQCRLTASWGLFSPRILPKETFWSQVWASQVGAAAPQRCSVLSAARYEWDTTPFSWFFFFCKVTKSLLSLSHLLPQCELNLQLLMFLFISVA